MTDFNTLISSYFSIGGISIFTCNYIKDDVLYLSAGNLAWYFSFADIVKQIINREKLVAFGWVFFHFDCVILLAFIQGFWRTVSLKNVAGILGEVFFSLALI